MRIRHWALSLGMRLLLGLSLLGANGVFSPTTAHAAAATNHIKQKALSPLVTAPAATQSWYENTTDAGTLQNQGCNAAHSVSTGLIVLDWGQIDAYNGTYGVYDFAGVVISDTAVLHASANFIQGIWNCRSSSTNFAVAIGLSNYGSCFCSSWYTAGQDWANMVNSVQSFVSNNGMGNQIGVHGAIDAEVEWASFTNTKAFVDGYNANTSRLLFDFGDDSGGTNPYPYTAYDVWYIAYGATDDLPLPEIYYQADATADWEPLSIWACNNEGGPMYIKGTMAQYPNGGNTPAQAYTQMYNAIASNSCTSKTLPYFIFSTNIDYA